MSGEWWVGGIHQAISSGFWAQAPPGTKLPVQVSGLPGDRPPPSSADTRLDHVPSAFAECSDPILALKTQTQGALEVRHTKLKTQKTHDRMH